MSNRSLTNAEFAVLGLVVEAPRHGYELEQIIEQRGMREWTEIGFSSIYFVLGKLQKAGLVVPEKPKGAKARKVFHATPTGRASHMERTREALSVPNPVYPSILLGLANWPALPRDEALKALRRRKAAVAEILGHVKARHEAQPMAPDFVHALFQYSIMQLEADMSWIAGALKMLGDENGKI